MVSLKRFYRNNLFRHWRLKCTEQACTILTQEYLSCSWFIPCWEHDTLSSHLKSQFLQLKIITGISKLCCCGFRSSGMQCCLTRHVVPDVAKDCFAFISKSWGVQKECFECFTTADESNAKLWNVWKHSANDRVSYPRRPKSSTRKKCYLPLLDTKPSDSKAFTAVLTEMSSNTVNRPSC